MPRRTKRLLLLLALCLLLLGIPVVYLVLSWSPANPLRVRLLTAEERPQPPVSIDPQPPMTFLMLENTSSVPIHLYSLSEGDRFPTDSWSSYGPLATAPTKPAREFLMLMRTVPTLVIPPHSAVKVDLLQTNASAQHPPDKVACITASSTKKAVQTTLDWCYTHSPNFLRSLIPDVPPDYHVLPVDSSDQPSTTSAPSR